MGYLYSVYRSAGGVGAKLLCAAYEAVLMGAAPPAGFEALCSIPIVVIPSVSKVCDPTHHD